MRTTIELSDERRARLLELAARRGHKGFSSLIEEAVDLYLRRDAERDEARRLALSRRGSLNRRDTEQLRAAVTEWREHWR